MGHDYCLHAAEVLVLTHERASAEEVLPYIRRIFYPLPVVCLFGRCAPQSPQINKESCVYYGWKDWLVPNHPAKPTPRRCIMSF